MANYVTGGAATFDALLLGDQAPITTNLIRQQFASIGQNLSQASMAFVEQVRNTAEELSVGFAAQLVRAAGRALDSLWLPDTIQVLNNIAHIQHAPNAMRRWVMAMPEARELYHAGRTEGYGEYYIDREPGKIGEDHYDWRRVHNGVMQTDVVEDGEEYEFKITTYFEHLREEDTELDLVQQADIQATWQAIRPMLKAGGEDPFSRWNAQLG